MFARPRRLKPALMIALALLLLGIYVVSAQHGHDENCDLEALLEHQREHAESIANLEEDAHNDLDLALENLYKTGIAYQALAIQCGFTRIAEIEEQHELEHSAEDHAADEAALEVALTVGDPARGEVLFNQVQPEAGFACSTCHRVDTTEQLIGPGLLGVGSPEHDPAAHGAELDEATAEPMEHMMHMGEATAEPAGHGHEAGEATAEPADHGHEADEAADMAATIDYLRTSIVDPSAFIVPGFVDNLMPKTYAEIFTEDDINDIIAYLITLTAD